MGFEIDRREVAFLQARQRDDVGRTFAWDGRVFRAIFPQSADWVRRLFAMGFLDELVARGYSPAAWMTDYRLDGFPLVVEHEKIWPVVYPQEWTFSMLQDAAVLVCRVAVVAKRYGVNMKDCHGLNVLFDGVEPKFTDLGSFIPDECLGWRPYEEFLRFYCYPLRMWSHNSFLGKLSIFSGNLTPHESYWQYRYPVLRWRGRNPLRRLLRWHLLLRLLPSRPDAEFRRRGWTPGRVLRELLSAGPVKIGSMDLRRVMRGVERIRQDSHSTRWRSYHENLQEKARRFDRIVEIVNSLGQDVATAVDLGGNQGRLSRRLAEETSLERVICIDYDEGAVAAGYRRQRQDPVGDVTFANFDFMGPIVKLRFALPQDRFKADVALALALTHHLLLSQGYDIDNVLAHVGAYARKYVLVEFMPKGLWPGAARPEVPSWYTRDWFRQSFASHFDLALEEELRENNVLFVGQVRADRSDRAVQADASGLRVDRLLSSQPKGTPAE
jgi:hypothetical protein